MSSGPDGGSKAAPAVGLTESVKGKRKRVDEGDRAGRLPKKQKSVHKEEETIVILDNPSGGTPETTESEARHCGRTRRSLRNKQVTEDEPKPTADKKQCDPIIILDSPTSESCSKGKEKMYYLSCLFLFFFCFLNLVIVVHFSQIVVPRMCPGPRSTSHSNLVTSLETPPLLGSCTGLRCSGRSGYFFRNTVN